MEYNFSNIPGYCTKEEADIVYSLVRATPTSEILEVGAFMGKLTAGLAETFPEIQFTAVDSWAYTTIDQMFEPKNQWTNENYIGLISTHDVFKKFTHEYVNIASVKSDFLRVNGNYDVIILSIDAKGLEFCAAARIKYVQ